MPGTFASCVLTALLLSLTWADHHHHHQESELSCHKLSSPNADFAFALYKSLNAQTAAGKNIFFSPLGISTALSMLSTGASGETHSQLFSSLGYSTLNQTQVNEAYEHLLHMLGQSQEHQQLNLGNAVALHSGFNPLEKFLNDVKHYYSGEMFTVDFFKPQEAATEINTYIANKTHDKIKNMVKDLDSNTVMVLINYVYFRGEWVSPFSSSNTHKEDFQVDENTKVQVDMMINTDYYTFYRDSENHTTILVLPYKGNTSMMIAMPDNGKMKEVEGLINKDYIRHWHNKLLKSYVEVHIPKFSISTGASLENILKEMGITDAFGDNADFSAMSDNVELKVSKVSHQAFLSVDETGTEAAATTTVEVTTKNLPFIIRVNQPFLVFILERSSRNVLFMGKISDPTAVGNTGTGISKTVALEDQS
ncbi:alpha-1-antitrypsin homolog isoform X2 [Mastacembelus armatus]|uniref:Alpha-1-antitrypsin homolog n=2 Tax=Mastacembelus armatus TaxID=205130 RepID=A0A3Q3RW66_9TELE|nr:alpha-1-antitrypsin homolog isoform X2 [Mastacembelus armatus]